MAEPPYTLPPNFLSGNKTDPAQWIVPLMEAGARQSLEKQQMALEVQRIELAKQRDEAKIKGEELDNISKAQNIKDSLSAAPVMQAYSEGNFDVDIPKVGLKTMEQLNAAKDFYLTKSAKGQARLAVNDTFRKVIEAYPDAAGDMEQFKPYSPPWNDALRGWSNSLEIKQKKDALESAALKMSMQAQLKAEADADIEKRQIKLETVRDKNLTARQAAHDENQNLIIDKKLQQNNFNQEVKKIRTDQLDENEGNNAIRKLKRNPQFKDIFPEEHTPQAKAQNLRDLKKLNLEMGQIAQKIMSQYTKAKESTGAVGLAYSGLPWSDPKTSPEVKKLIKRREEIEVEMKELEDNIKYVDPTDSSAAPVAAPPVNPSNPFNLNLPPAK